MTSRPRAEAAAQPTEEAIEAEVEHVVEQAIGFPEALVEDTGADGTEPATEA